jgi:peptide/nickel transport system permease protein
MTAARHPMLLAGAVVPVLPALSAIAAPLWTSGDPQQMSPGVRLRAPGAGHVFGTDHFGRDIFARTLYGGRISLRVGVIVALVVPEIPRVVRVVRAQVLTLREHTMVEGARAIGAGIPRVQGTHICASAILVESYLSFLGAGTAPHIPSWGHIMAEGRAYVQLGVWIILFPGLFLMQTVLAINLIGDGLRDLLKV